MKKQLIYLVILIGGLAVTSLYVSAQNKKQDKKTMESQKVQYTCSMHHDFKSDKPGKCPKCGMELVAMKDIHPGKTMHDMGDTTMVMKHHNVMHDSTMEKGHPHTMYDSTMMMKHHQMKDSVMMKHDNMKK